MRRLVPVVVFLLFQSGCRKPFDRAAAERALDVVSLMECSRIGGDGGSAVVTATFDPSGKVTYVDVADMPAKPDAQIHYPPLKPETVQCVANKIRAEARVAPFDGSPAKVTREVELVKMSDWHRP